jgi:hypothetical protein
MPRNNESREKIELQRMEKIIGVSKSRFILYSSEEWQRIAIGLVAITSCINKT